MSNLLDSRQLKIPLTIGLRESKSPEPFKPEACSEAPEQSEFILSASDRTTQQITGTNTDVEFFGIDVPKYGGDSKSHDVSDTGSKFQTAANPSSMKPADPSGQQSLRVDSMTLGMTTALRLL